MQCLAPIMLQHTAKQTSDRTLSVLILLTPSSLSGLTMHRVVIVVILASYSFSSVVLSNIMIQIHLNSEEFSRALNAN